MVLKNYWRLCLTTVRETTGCAQYTVCICVLCVVQYIQYAILMISVIVVHIKLVFDLS